MPMPLSRDASLSAPTFVRQNTSTGPVASSRSQRASHDVFSFASTVWTACEIVCAGPPRRPTCTSFGARRNSCVSFRISAGMVAEKSSVWRAAGSVARIRWTSGQKPMSSMRSASSSTSTSSPLKFVVS
jgi:hypothetical protein